VLFRSKLLAGSSLTTIKSEFKCIHFLYEGVFVERDTMLLLI